MWILIVIYRQKNILIRNLFIHWNLKVFQGRVFDGLTFSYVTPVSDYEFKKGDSNNALKANFFLLNSWVNIYV